MQRLFKVLPKRFKWTIHNMIGHPLSEVLFQLGFEKLGNEVHDRSAPAASQ